MNNNDNEDNVRSILKTGAGFQPTNTIKTAKFDELNVLQTFHPINKDYGHMIIDEPKTPFVFDDQLPRELDTESLMEKLRQAAQTESPAFCIEGDSDESSDDEDYPESVEEKVHRLEFERRRKLHYKEFMSVPLARRLIAEEFNDWSTSEVSISDERQSGVDSCEAEVCPSYESTYFSEVAKSITGSDGMIQPEPEPGFHPSHPCYFKLMAEIEAEAHRPNESIIDVVQAETASKRGSGPANSRLESVNRRPTSTTLDGMGSKMQGNTSSRPSKSKDVKEKDHRRSNF